MSIILKGILALFWLLLVPAAIGILVMSKRKDICSKRDFWHQWLWPVPGALILPW